MTNSSKTAQLQIRVSPAEKQAIQRTAARAGMDMSSYVLQRLLASPERQFQHALRACRGSAGSYELAELNDLLAALTANALREAVATAPLVPLDLFTANYVAAMVEQACDRRAIPVPVWTQAVAPLAEPYFGSTLESLRLYLLTHSPPPFRRRNLFVDAGVGDRV